MRDQFSGPYKTTCKLLIFFYIFIFKFLERKREDRFWTEWYQAFPEFNLLLISWNKQKRCIWNCRPVLWDRCSFYCGACTAWGWGCYYVRRRIYVLPKYDICLCAVLHVAACLTSSVSWFKLRQLEEHPTSDLFRVTAMCKVSAVKSDIKDIFPFAVPNH